VDVVAVNATLVYVRNTVTAALCASCSHLVVNGHPSPQLRLQVILWHTGCLLIFGALHLPICALQCTGAAVSAHEAGGVAQRIACSEGTAGR
jgi:hypothetical protein